MGDRLKEKIGSFKTMLKSNFELTDEEDNAPLINPVNRSNADNDRNFDKNFAYELDNDDVANLYNPENQTPILMGVTSFLSYKNYWAKGIKYFQIAEIIQFNRFEKIQKFLCFVYNNDQDRLEKLFKIRPILTGRMCSCGDR